MRRRGRDKGAQKHQHGGVAQALSPVHHQLVQVVYVREAEEERHCQHRPRGRRALRGQDFGSGFIWVIFVVALRWWQG